MPIGAFKLNTLAKLIAAVISRSAKTVTAYGNAQVDTAQSKFGGASFLGDGNGDYLQISTYSDLSLTGDFTIECWYRLPGTVPSILSFYNSDHLFYLTNDAGTAKYAIFQGGNNRLLSSGVTVSANTWYHVAYVRSGSTITVYHNGTSAGTATWSSTIGNTTPTIGVYSTNYLNGWIDEFRVSDNARYTTGFTPSTTSFTNDANTLLLLHMDGTDASTVFTDDNGVRNKKGIAAIGNAQVDTAQSKFGGASALFDGTGDWLKLDATPDLNFGTNDFTIEFWARMASLNNDTMIIGSGASSFATGALGIAGGTSSFGIRFFSYDYNSSGTGLVKDPSAMTVGTWYHYALVRSGNNWTLYRDGTSVSTGTWSGSVNFNSNSATYIGYAGWGGVAMNGWLDEIRISNTARYSSNFTPSASAFTNDANTLFLMHANGTDASTAFTDDNA